MANKELILVRVGGVATLIGREYVQLEWDGVRVGIARDVWDGIGGAWFDRVTGIRDEVVKRGLSGDLTVRGKQCPNS